MVMKLQALGNAAAEIPILPFLLSQACLELLPLASPPHHLRSSFNHAEPRANVVPWARSFRRWRDE